MAGKTRKTDKQAEAVQVFRQFAWHLVGTLTKSPRTQPPRGTR